MDLNSKCMKCMTDAIQNGVCSVCGAPAVFTQEPLFALPIRSILHGRYLVGFVLGFGGFGITYIGYDIQHPRKVAIKEYMPNGLASRRPGTTEVTVNRDQETYNLSMSRFLEEAQTIYKYQGHQNIIQVYSLFKENHTAYYVMEYLQGQDLKHYVRSLGGHMNWQQLSPIIYQILNALEIVHNEGIIHRDVSPDNIYIEQNGEAKLIDFGAARFAYSGKSLSVILKQGFAPSEQYITHGRQGPWTDLYALAGSAYSCLTGVIPPAAPERMKEDTLKSPSQLGVILPANVEYALMKALNMDIALRYDNATELRRDLYPEQVKAMQQVPVMQSTPIMQQAPVAACQCILCGTKGMYQSAIIPVLKQVVAGRSAKSCNLVFPEQTAGVSKVHWCIENIQGFYCIMDQNSTNGTYINGKKITPGSWIRLTSGDRISFGSDNEFQIKF